MMKKCGHSHSKGYNKITSTSDKFSMDKMSRYGTKISYTYVIIPS